MKKSMWKVDKTGGFSFSDKHGLGQLSLLTSYGDASLEAELERGLAGRTMSVLEIKEWVLTETPAYLFKGPLAKLEKRGVVKALKPPTGRKPGTYPDSHANMRMQFEMSMFGGSR